MLLVVWSACRSAPVAPVVEAPVPTLSPVPAALTAFPTFQRVGIGTGQARLLETLGPPTSTKVLPYDPADDMGLGRQRELDWPGLHMLLGEPDGATEPVVASFTITAPGRALLGVEVGDSESMLLAAFGPPESATTQGGDTRLTWHLEALDGFVWAVVREDRVVELRVFEDWS